MKKLDFKLDVNAKIIRKTGVPNKKYTSHMHDLMQDFHDRCGYCDSPFELVMTREIDHFIPKHVCKEFGREDLIDDYSNLVLSCKKCNRTKAGKCSGNIQGTSLSNKMFIDPALTDYNDILFRNEYGIIFPKSQEGELVNKNLKLHNPVYALSWFIEKVERYVKNCEVNCTDLSKMKLVIELQAMTKKLRDLFCKYYDLLG